MTFARRRHFQAHRNATPWRKELSSDAPLGDRMTNQDMQLTSSAAFPYKAARDFGLRQRPSFVRPCPFRAQGFADEVALNQFIGLLSARLRRSKYRPPEPEHARETDLSTKQDCAQAPARLPCTDGHDRRPPSDCGPPRPWSQAPLGLTGPFPVSRVRQRPVPGHGTLGHTTSGHRPSGDAAAVHERVGRGPPRLKKRAQFRDVAKGARFHGRSFSLQAARRTAEIAEGPRVGFTVTRKAGTAVERNRMRRRLKEALRLAPDLCTAPDHDYVLIIRREALSTPFAELIGELTRAFRDIESRKGRRTRAGAERPPAGRATS